MARIRSIHPGIYTDESWASVSPTARWLGIGLTTECDDIGIFEWKPIQIRMRIFPADNVDIALLLGELESAQILLSFEVSGKRYGAMRNFCKFQRPRKPKAVFPTTDSALVFVNAMARSAVSDELDDGDDAPVPQKSEPEKRGARRVPQKSEPSTDEAGMVTHVGELAGSGGDQVTQMSGKSPQMEDGGCNRKDNPHRRRSTPPPAGEPVDDDDLIKKLRSAGGGKIDEAILSPDGVVPIRALIDLHGFDLEGHILPAIADACRHLKKPPLHSFSAAFLRSKFEARKSDAARHEKSKIDMANKIFVEHGTAAWDAAAARRRAAGKPVPNPIKSDANDGRMGWYFQADEAA